MTACPSGCGRCCDPVTLPFSRLDAETAPPGSIDERDRRWILEDLTPLRRRDGIAATADYLTEGGRTEVIIRGVPEIMFTTFWTCRWFDPETRACTNYDDRPPMCDGYPWYGGPPDPRKNIPPECAFRADRGEVPVALTRKAVP